MMVRSLWRGEVPAPATQPNMKDIAAEVAARRGVSIAEMKGPVRTRSIAWARQEAMYLMANVRTPDGSWRYSSPQIGAFFNRDHTTVLFAVAKVAFREGYSQERTTFKDIRKSGRRRKLANQSTVSPDERKGIAA